MGHRVDIDWEAGTVTAVRRLRQSGGSTVLTIPPEVLDALQLEEGADLEMVANREEGVVEIRPVTNDADEN